jgi:hypothetical protein
MYIYLYTSINTDMCIYVSNIFKDAWLGNICLHKLMTIYTRISICRYTDMCISIHIYVFHI